MFKIEVDNHEVRALLNLARQRTEHLQPLMENIALFMRRSIVKNFDEGGRPNPWEASKRGAMDGGKATLTDTGRLKDSITAFSTNTTAEVGSNVEYAPFHQFGTNPYDIKPRNKKALAFGGRVVKRVHHPGLPARPFMMVQDSDWKIIEAMVGDFITG